MTTPQEIDQVWHYHILHTRKYYQDCQMLFSRFLHHEPDVKYWGQPNPLSLNTAFAQTTALLVQYFGDAALGDASLEQLDSLLIAENLPHTELQSNVEFNEPLQAQSTLR